MLNGLKSLSLFYQKKLGPDLLSEKKLFCFRKHLTGIRKSKNWVKDRFSKAFVNDHLMLYPLIEGFKGGLS